MTLRARPTRAAVWGDGFVDDNLGDMSRVDSWATVHSDEYVRLFPWLAAPEAGCPPPLLLHLTEAVAVNAWRLQRHGAQGRILSGIEPEAVPALGRQCEDEWFERPSRLRATIARHLGLGGRAETVVSLDEAAVGRLDALLCELRHGSTPAYDEGVALGLAFHAGIHPAYLWSEARLIDACTTAAGWLGVLARGRSALLPLDIAEFLGDAVEVRDTLSGRPRDPRLAICMLAPGQWATVGVAARRRLAGRSETIRLNAPRAATPTRPSMIDPAAMQASAAQR